MKFIEGKKVEGDAVKVEAKYFEFLPTPFFLNFLNQNLRLEIKRAVDGEMDMWMQRPR